MTDNELLSEEARRIMATPFPAKTALLLSASPQVKAEVAMECQRRLNEKFPEKKDVTDAVANFLLDE
jgi:hypothetical protein